MRWLVPMLLLAGCAVDPATDTATMTASLEQPHYVTKPARPRGAPVHYIGAKNCGTPDQWKACPRVQRPSVTVFIDVATTGNNATDQQDWAPLNTEPAQP
jgi:hypothetical protein